MILLPAMLAIVLTLWRTRFGLFAILACLPLYEWRTTIAGLPTTALELTVLAVVIVAFVQLARQHAIKSSFRELTNVRAITLPVLLFAIAALVGVFIAPSLYTAFGAYRAWVLEPLAVAALAIVVLRRREDLTDAALTLGVSGGLLSLYGLGEFLLAPERLGDGRLDSIFVPANYHAMLTVPVMVLLLALLLGRAVSGWRRWTAITSLIALAAALYATYSFGGYIAFGAGALVVIISTYSRRLWRPLAVLAALTALVLAAQLSTFKVWNIFNLAGRSSTSVRLQVWHSAAVMVQEHPVVGIGYGTFETAYREVVPRLYWPPLEWLVTQPHNLALALWTETGLAGLVTFVWLVTAALVRLRAHPRSALSVGFAATLTAMLIHGLVDTPVFKNDLAVLFWFTIAALAVLTRDPRQERLRVVE